MKRSIAAFLLILVTALGFGFVATSIMTGSASANSGYQNNGK